MPKTNILNENQSNEKKNNLNKENNKYKEKCVVIEKTIKEIVFHNGSLEMEIKETLEKINKLKTQRKFLLVKLIEYEKLDVNKLKDNTIEINKSDSCLSKNKLTSEAKSKKPKKRNKSSSTSVKTPKNKTKEKLNSTKTNEINNIQTEYNNIDNKSTNIKTELTNNETNSSYSNVLIKDYDQFEFFQNNELPNLDDLIDEKVFEKNNLVSNYNFSQKISETNELTNINNFSVVENKILPEANLTEAITNDNLISNENFLSSIPNIEYNSNLFVNNSNNYSSFESSDNDNANKNIFDKNNLKVLFNNQPVNNQFFIKPVNIVDKKLSSNKYIANFNRNTINDSYKLNKNFIQSSIYLQTNNSTQFSKLC